MNKKQLFQESELADSDIGRPCRLKTLEATDTDPDVCRLNHGDIIGPITYGQKNGLHVLLNKLDNKSFLQGRDTAYERIQYSKFLTRQNTYSI